MSKFFKALEKIEHERGEARAETVMAVAPVAEPEVEPKRPEPEPKRPEPMPEIPRVEPKPEPPRRQPPQADPPPAAVATPPAVETLFKRPAMPPAAVPVYGAPVRENGTTFGRKGFAWQIDGEVDSEPGQLDDHLVSLLEPTSHAAEQYRAVRLAIETFRHERGTRTVAITSPGRGDGRTITALNLAGALAQAPDARVVLVEADLRHPGAARALGLPATRGLSSYLLDSTMAVDTVVARPAGVAFAIVPAGAASSMPYELLKSPRLAGLLAALRDRFDYVVVDTPPALPYPDVGILRDLVDGFVVVVRANRTPREMLRDCMNVVGRQRGLGLIFNDDERSSVTTINDDEPTWRRLMPRPLGGTRVG
ncbi:MAG TPA: CpsD/CapB family tyrosine-protein kinase [Methylomirabilota bacterium]|nr:CpsD/CapB family tyrosine-protein kinase [Methylomirabilota bacterium]